MTDASIRTVNREVKHSPNISVEFATYMTTGLDQSSTVLTATHAGWGWVLVSTFGIACGAMPVFPWKTKNIAASRKSCRVRVLSVTNYCFSQRNLSVVLNVDM
jgi:hypothetical protein